MADKHSMILRNYNELCDRYSLLSNEKYLKIKGCSEDAIQIYRHSCIFLQEIMLYGFSMLDFYLIKLRTIEKWDISERDDGLYYISRNLLKFVLNKKTLRVDDNPFINDEHFGHDVLVGPGLKPNEVALIVDHLIPIAANDRNESTPCPDQHNYPKDVYWFFEQLSKYPQIKEEHNGLQFIQIKGISSCLFKHNLKKQTEFLKLFIQMDFIKGNKVSSINVEGSKLACLVFTKPIDKIV